MRSFLFSEACIILIAAICIQANVNTLTWDEAYAKAKRVVNQMNLEQKIITVSGIGYENGLCAGNTNATIDPDYPSFCLQDSPIGVRFADDVTAGVAGINAAASFDRDAIRKRGEYLGKEFRGKGVHVQLGPALNFLRSPQGGRNWESGGEDPYLTGVLAEETVIGVQSQGVIAMAKHYLMNEQEIHRNITSSEVDDRTLHEIYLWPFARAVEAGVGSVMCSYNKINGAYACENDYTLNTILKGELGFKGFVCSDWTGTMSTVTAANNGLDMNMPGEIKFEGTGSYFGQNLTDAVKNNQVPESRITDMAMRVVASRYKMRQDQSYPEVALNSFNLQKAPEVNVQDDHKKLVREMGAASNALLKNNDEILPLDLDRLKSIAIIGSDAGPHPGGRMCEDDACIGGALGWGSGTVKYPYYIDPLQGLKNAFGSRELEIISSLDDWDLKKAAQISSTVDCAIVFSSANSGEEHVVFENNFGDRNNISLWQNGDNLIQAVADANENTIVVIHSVGPVLMPWINHPNIKAILWPGLAGQESGNSLADVMMGKVNPSGRLPYTIAEKQEDYVAGLIREGSFIDYSEKLLLGYRWFDFAGIKPLFPFGHGLSYTKFEYSKVSLSTITKKSYGKNEEIISEAFVTVSLTIENVGDYDGAEVYQVYISFPEYCNEPPKVLRYFEKRFIREGRHIDSTFTLRKKELSIWDTENKEWMIPSGKYTLHIGASSRDIRHSSDFTLYPF
ncbi:glycoside hydrolase superfamily [Pilaira anomala]|nr:glycoside hydrolase superfamily [Pilaira anomala]